MPPRFRLRAGGSRSGVPKKLTVNSSLKNTSLGCGHTSAAFNLAVAVGRLVSGMVPDVIEEVCVCQDFSRLGIEPDLGQRCAVRGGLGELDLPENEIEVGLVDEAAMTSPRAGRSAQ